MMRPSTTHAGRILLDQDRVAINGAAIGGLRRVLN